MIGLLAIVDKIFTALSITKSASDLNDEINESDKNTKSNVQDRDVIIKQRQDEMKTTREQQAKHENINEQSQGQQR